jgi:hypothetical protein
MPLSATGQTSSGLTRTIHDKLSGIAYGNLRGGHFPLCVCVIMWGKERLGLLVTVISNTEGTFLVIFDFLLMLPTGTCQFTERNSQFNRYIGQQITFFHIPGETYSACSSLGLLNWKKLTVAEEDRNLVNTRKTQLDVKFQSCTCFFCICRNSQIICPYTFYWICVHVALISQEKYLA